ncbi:MAG: ribosome small subunit-dependent GTPase A [Cellvibrionales bacterium]|nr:ribosome small subunit-dependent GTPase A [Cellvibrionales bacterium]
MAKKRLTQQQLNRIRSRRDQNVNRLKKNSDDVYKGLVVARYSKHVQVKLLEGPKAQEIFRANLRRQLDSIAVGDELAVSFSKDDILVIDARLERRSELLRPDGFGNMKAIAANIDAVFIVIAKVPEVHTTLLDRYLAAAEVAGINASIVINKADLLSNDEAFTSLISIYESLGYPVHLVSAKNGVGLDRLDASITNATCVFAGQSGVGKSSLVNTLLGAEAKVGELSSSVAKGKHTTTTAELYFLPNGGRLIDSPGIREFHLTHLDANAVYQGFREFHAVLGHCQFRDCHHHEEPGCAVNALIDAGGIQSSRLNSLEYILGANE